MKCAALLCPTTPGAVFVLKPVEVVLREFEAVLRALRDDCMAISERTGEADKKGWTMKHSRASTQARPNTPAGFPSTVGLEAQGRNQGI